MMFHCGFDFSQTKGTLISGPNFKEKAMIFLFWVGRKNRVCSNGCLDRWKRWHSEHLSQASFSRCSSEFGTKLEKIIGEESTDQINLWDRAKFQMIARIIFFDGNSSYGLGLKLNTERITVILCSNISGSNELHFKLLEKPKNQEHLKIGY